MLVCTERNIAFATAPRYGGECRAPSSKVREFHGAKLATRNRHPIAALSAEKCTEQMGVPSHGFHAQRWQRTAIRILRAAPACSRSDSGGGEAPRSSWPLAVNY